MVYCNYCSCCCKRKPSLCYYCKCCQCCCNCPPQSMPCLPCMPPMPCLPPPPPPCQVIRERVLVPCPCPYPVPTLPQCCPYNYSSNQCCSDIIDYWNPPCECRWPFPKSVHCPGEPVMPGYKGHIPGLKFHGAGRTFGDATRDTRCIMSQWFTNCKRLPWRVFER